MGRKKIPRVEMVTGPWHRPTMRPAEIGASDAVLGWDATKLLPTTTQMGRILDEFVWIGRSADLRWQRDAAETFTQRWGPWAYCRHPNRHVHRPFIPGDATAPRSGGAVSGAERVSDLAASAARIDALRRIVLRLWGIPVPTDRLLDWRRLYGERIDDRFVPAPDEEQARLEGVVNGMLETYHVVPEPRFGESAALAVSGVAGAIAVELLGELTVRPKLAACIRCFVTHYRQEEGEHLCPSCQSAVRNRVKPPPGQETTR